MRNPVMIGDRVYLRPFEVDDAAILAEATYTETDTFMERGRELGEPMESEDWIRGLYEQHPGTQAKFAMCLRDNDLCIGLAGLEFVDLINGVAATGTRFHNPEYRNRGYGTEAKHLVLEYAFQRLHLERIVSFVFEPNARSSAALMKQGYRPAGRLKYEDIKDGRFQDTLVFDLLPEEWLAARDAWQREHSARDHAK
ncbi:MAG: GNAT family protein [Thermomicrobiaceae bacterium]